MNHQKISRVVLFVNGDLPAPEKVRTWLVDSSAGSSGEDFLIAVDGGLRHLESLGLTPHLVIGDLDSADSKKIAALRQLGVEVQSFPAEKNETDLELALNAAVNLKPESIWVVAALGNRLDQTLANIFLLTHPNLASTQVTLFDGITEVCLVRTSKTIRGEIGQRLSLLPINGPAEGIYTDGLKYPLTNETLYPEKTRGISNVIVAPTVTVRLKSGLLLCIREV